VKHRISVLVSTPDRVTFKIRPIDIENHVSGAFGARLDTLDEMRLRSSAMRVLMGPHVWQPGGSEIDDVGRNDQQFMAANHWWYAGEGRAMLFCPGSTFQWGGRDEEDPYCSDVGFLGRRDFCKAVAAIGAPMEKGVVLVTPASIEYVCCYRQIQGDVVSELIRSAYDGRAYALYSAIGAVGTEGAEPLAQRCKQRGLLEQLCLTRIVADGVRVRNISDIEGFVVVEPKWARRAPAPDELPPIGSWTLIPPVSAVKGLVIDAKTAIVEEAFADPD
jgi:hypothetical protein